jgi:hypothetical protein
MKDTTSTNFAVAGPGGPRGTSPTFFNNLALDKLFREHLRDDRERGCSNHSNLAPAPPRAMPSGTPAASGCAAFVGGVELPAALRVRTVVPHTGAGRQAEGKMGVRFPASARCMRVVRPRARTGVGEAHTHLADAVVMDMLDGPRFICYTNYNFDFVRRFFFA